MVKTCHLKVRLTVLPNNVENHVSIKLKFDVVTSS
jgi:hypothetical protein